MPATRHQYRIYIKATPEVVWQALIDPKFTRTYFHGTALDPAPKTGGQYRSVLPDGRLAVEGVVEEFDPPRRFVHTWRVLYDAAMAEEPPSRVEWTITPVAEGLTQLDLVHGDLARSPLTWAGVKDGWIWILDAMKTLVETGEALPDVEVKSPPMADADAAWHRAQAIECNNAIWELLDGERNPANDEELLRRAFASAYHWDRAERRGPANEARRSLHAVEGPPPRRATSARPALRQGLPSPMRRTRPCRLRSGLCPRGHRTRSPRARPLRRGGGRVARRSSGTDRRSRGQGDPRCRLRGAAGAESGLSGQVVCRSKSSRTFVNPNRWMSPRANDANSGASASAVEASRIVSDGTTSPPT